MGNHNLSCEFCGEDTIGLGAKCHDDCSGAQEARRVRIQAAQAALDPMRLVGTQPSEVRQTRVATLTYHRGPDLKLAWEKFRIGDSLTDSELAALIRDMESGIEFLQNRGETGGVLYKARQDQVTLMGFQMARLRRKS